MMPVTLLLATVLAPLAVVAISVYPAARRATDVMAPWTATFALAAAIFVPINTGIALPWLLLDSQIGLDVLGKYFLGFTSWLWLLSGIYARSYLRDDATRSRFFAFYLAAMAGNFGLIVAQDLVTFIAFFAVMSFAAYGVITHQRDTRSMQAGQTYIVLVVIGEILVFAGLVLSAIAVDNLMFASVREGLHFSLPRHAIIASLLLGFGIKLGIVPLHFWLPLAHPVAPTPASAVLSGAMIKAGLLGYLRFLPLGEATMPTWGALCITVGFTTAFYGVVAGLMQRNAKTVLAYSSVSQMGLVTVAVGSIFTEPTARTSVAAALIVFAMHHAISKGALFLGVGVADCSIEAAWKKWLVRGGLILPALALAGAPSTFGGVAKTALKQTTTIDTMPWAMGIKILLPLSTIATTLIMCRFLYIVWPCRRDHNHRLSYRLWLPWSLLVVSVVGMPWIFQPHDAFDKYWFKISVAVMWKSIWPILVGILLAALPATHTATAVRLSRFHVPAGDIIVPIRTLSMEIFKHWNRRLLNPLARFSWRIASWWSTAADPNVVLQVSRLTWLERWGAVGTAAMLLATTLLVLLLLQL